MESSTSNTERPPVAAGNATSQATSNARKTNASATPPPGFKFIKVKKPDGTLVTVKKALTPEEIEAAAKKQATDSQFEIVTVKKPDGTLAKVRRPVKALVESQENMAATKAVTPKPTSAQPPATQAPHAKTSDVAVLPTPTAKPQPATTTKPQSGSDAAQAPKAAAAVPPASDSIEQAKAQADYQAALRAQDEYYKKVRQHKFKNALQAGLMRTVAGAAGDAIMDLSDDDDADDSDDDHGSIGKKGGSNRNSIDQNHHAKEYGAAATKNTISALGAPGAAPVKPPAYPTTEAERAGGKVTYKIDDKHLNEMDEKAAALEDKPLQRHWANISFYLLASLSVVLPLLFLILAIAIALMDGKSVNSHWGLLKNPIIIAVSMWPIVFAAVVAQAFKTWATFRVERGIKLMELEQLVGSNSFGSVMKQPFMLRRLDLLTLGIFLVWCLSPIGSQALQRSYGYERGTAEDNTTVYYAHTFGTNQLFSPDTWTRLNDSTRGTLMQMASVYYISSFAPPPVSTSADPKKRVEDPYNHPLTFEPFITGSYGIPVVLPPGFVPSEDSISVASVLQPFEYYYFNTTSSFFNFTCGPWREVIRHDINDYMYFSLSQTFGMNMSYADDNATSVSRLAYASLAQQVDLKPIQVNTSDDSYVDTSFDPNWKYLYVECGFEQLFLTSEVNCTTDVVGSTFVPNCQVENSTVIPASQVPKEWHTDLYDFSFDFVSFGSPFAYANTTTPTERYADYGLLVDSTNFTPNATEILEFNGPEYVRQYLGYVFNTMVRIGYCPACVIETFNYTDTFQALRSQGFYTPVEADHQFSQDIIFSTSKVWVGVLFACVISLLLVGTASIVVESMVVAPDVLGYVSTTVRNSRYLNLPKTTTGAMSGSERARRLGTVEVMMQDVKAGADVGKIALGLKKEGAERLKPGRVYR